LLKVAFGMFSESAARVKLPASTTRPKARRASNWSKVVFPEKRFNYLRM